MMMVRNQAHEQHQRPGSGPGAELPRAVAVGVGAKKGVQWHACVKVDRILMRRDQAK